MPGRPSSFALLLGCLLSCAAFAGPRATLEPAANETASAAALAALDRLSHDPSLAALGVPTHVDELYAVPSFLVASPGAAMRAAKGATAEQAARADLARLARYYRLDAADVQDAPLQYVNDTGTGGIVAAFRQEVDGVPVFREEMKVLLARDLRLVAIAGSIPSRSEAKSRAFRLSMTDAIQAALSDMGGTIATLRHLESREGGYETYDAPGASVVRTDELPIRARRVYFRMGESLVPAYHVELTGPEEAPTYVISASDGAILLRHDRTAYDTFTYRVAADATGLKQPLDGPMGTSATPYPTATPSQYTPPFFAPPLVSLQNGPLSTNDPWLPSGATVTTGNNVDAYLYTGSVRATTTSVNTFDRTVDVNQQPDASTNQKLAGVTQAFYTENFLHDWYYDAGFNEAAGNAQLSNYGRGGLQNDRVIVMTQIDRTNNASMTPPADGASPVQKNYNWTFATIKQATFHSPAAIAGVQNLGASSSNPATVNVTGDVALPFPGTFSATTAALTVGSGPRFAQISDVNGDGWADLIVANASSNNVGVLLNDGAGGFAAPVTYATGTSPRMTVTPDLNHDGLPDLVSVNQTGGNISIRLGTGGGAFGPVTTLVSASGSNSIAVGRFNGDAHDDLVVTNSALSSVSVFLGDGAGSFATRVLYSMGTSPINVAVGDINGDGNSDLVAANFGAGVTLMSIRLGTGTGTFGAVTSDTLGNSPQDVALADLNGDGKLDAIASNTGNSTVSVALGNGNGTFATPVFYALPAAPIAVAAADFNGDGILDVIATEGTGSGTVSLLANNGAGVLGAAQTIAVGNTPAGFTLGDVNNDNQPDLAVANSGSGTVSLITGTVTPSPNNCPPFANALTGRIALLRMFPSDCVDPDAKIQEAQARGAIGVLMEFSPVADYQSALVNAIPAFVFATAGATPVRSALRAGTAPVNATLFQATPLDRDGALDNAILTHEYTHCVSNRLIGNGSGLTTTQSRGLGEGWSDFGALLLLVRPEDAAVASNPNWTGAYGAFGYVGLNSVLADDFWYFGFRQYPYSNDFARNPLTFHHISDGEPIVSSAPAGWVGNGSSEVHGAGTVWCTMLWECYASLLRDSGRLTFAQARDRMRRYFIQSLQMTPVNPTFTEARDALLNAAAATDLADYQLFRYAFARRGMGDGAVAPPRNSTNDSPVVESYTVNADLKVVSLGLDDLIQSCDHDGFLDSGEDGYLTLKLANPKLGSGILSGGTATFSSSNPNLQFPSGNTASFGTSQPGDTVLARVPVHGTGTGLQLDSLLVQYDGPAWIPAGPRSTSSTVFVNVDTTQTMSDNFEDGNFNPWSSLANDAQPAANSAPWALVLSDTSSSNHAYQCPILGAGGGATDQLLLSPWMIAADTGFQFTFKTRYWFDTGGTCGCNDGGVVEIQYDDGFNLDNAPWRDITSIPGVTMTPGYDHVMSASGPLSGRAIFGNQNPSYPGWNVQTVSIPPGLIDWAFVRIRFRAVGDGVRSGPGWFIDDLAVTGSYYAPFVAVAPQAPCGTVAVNDPAVPTLLAFALEGANPSLAAPRFRFELPNPAYVTIALYDVGGRRVATLANGDYQAGVFHASWNGAGAHAGVFFARMSAGGRVLSRRVVLLGG